MYSHKYIKNFIVITIKNGGNLKAYKKIQKYKPIEVPWNAWRLFSEQCKKIEVYGDQVSFGEDYATLEEARKAIEFYADQLGGTIKWKTKK